MGNSLPLTEFKERTFLEKSCCSCRKEEQAFVQDTNETEIQKRRGVRHVSFKTPAMRSAPYSSRIDIEGLTSPPTLPGDDLSPDHLGIQTCKNSDLYTLASWTIQEQQVLVDSLNEHPQARENESYRQKLMQRVQSELPNKSLDEIRRCYTHLMDIRLADVRQSRFSAIQSAGPRKEKELIFNT